MFLDVIGLETLGFDGGVEIELCSVRACLELLRRDGTLRNEVTGADVFTQSSICTELSITEGEEEVEGDVIVICGIVFTVFTVFWLRVVESTSWKVADGRLRSSRRS